MIVDYHMHLRDEDGEHRVHARRPCDRSWRRRSRRGVAEIGFTEHVYYFRQTAEIWEVPYLRSAASTISTSTATPCSRRSGRAAGEARPRGRLCRRAAARLAELLEPYPFDFLLGSVHWLDGMAVDMSPGVWELMTVDEGWQRYIDALCELAVSGQSTCSRIPISRRSSAGARAGPAGRAARAGRARGCGVGLAVEISTAGLRKPVGELYPDLDFLRASCAQARR